MCKNKRVVSVFVVAVWGGLLNTYSNGAAPIEFEGRFGLYEPLAVGIAAGTVENPELVRIERICFDAKYANAWGVTAHVGWLPVKDATWQLTIELLDKDGRVLHHSRDEPTVFTFKASRPGKTNMRYANLDLNPMQDQGRRYCARFRVRLEPLEDRIADTDSIHTLEVEVVDEESREAISDAIVVVSHSYLEDTFWRRKKDLYATDSQGRCRATLARDGLASIEVSTQKPGYSTIAKSWSNAGSWGLVRAPLVSLLERHEMEMVRASSLGGIVQDTQGNPVAGTDVCLDVHVEELSGTIYVNRTVRTNAEGRWRMDGIPGETERITLRVRHPDYGGNNGLNRHISGDALVNARALKHVVTLDKGITVTGRVLGEQERAYSRGDRYAGTTIIQCPVLADGHLRSLSIGLFERSI